MTNSAAKTGTSLARLLSIWLQDSDRDATDAAAREESVLPIHSNGGFPDGHPIASEWLHDQISTKEQAGAYARSLFPFISWVGHYNAQWFAGDIIAGITVGAVAVPQGMAYASLANLEPQFGLYSSFVGVMIYWVFGTSKDISIGPVAVLSTVVGSVVHEVTSQPNSSNVPPHVIASALSIVAGTIVLAVGLFRCGWIVDLISVTSLSAFMTGSAITIASSQLPSLLGLTGFSNRAPAYRVIMNTLEHLPDAKLDAVLGLTALFFLYLIRYTLASAAERYPMHKRAVFFLNTMRSVFVIVLFTMISWLLNARGTRDPLFHVLGTVPTGFQSIAFPELSTEVASKFGSYLPATVIVMLVEHIAIAKSFGRVNNYTIDSSQEMVAIGMTNILGPFLGGYPSTGSFSRTAIQSKAGVRTPAAGVVTGAVVLLATYLLTAAFFYIPSAVLSAVIIHAVGDLITTPDTVYQFSRGSPIEVFVFFVGVFVSLFAHIEDGLYATVLLSAAIFLYRKLRARGQLLGHARVHFVQESRVIGSGTDEACREYGTFDEPAIVESSDVFLPLDHEDGSDTEIRLDSPYPGVFIYRFSEGFSFPNANSSSDHLTSFILAQIQRTSCETYERAGDLPWDNPDTRNSANSRGDAETDGRPALKAIILDFSFVNNVDVTSIQRLIDARKELDFHTAPELVDWHVACIGNRWTMQALMASGFGGGEDSAAPAALLSASEHALQTSQGPVKELDEERGRVPESGDGLFSKPGDEKSEGSGKPKQWLRGTKRPLFHVDLTSAVHCAVATVKAKDELRASGGRPH